MNLNEVVHYELTTQGEEILRYTTNADRYAFLKGLNKSVTEEYREELVANLEEAYKESLTSMRLWEFMSVFGPHMRMGAEPVVKGNEIFFGEEIG